MRHNSSPRLIRRNIAGGVWRNFLALLCAWAVGLFGLAAQSSFAAQAALEGFKQILPRGAIAAITQPQYVAAEEANIAGSSYVLGVVIDGQARAYSLNLLNHHEVVNDQIGDKTFAAVW